MRRHHKASLFLMELIIAILFFSIASVVCLQVFVKASELNTQSQHKSQAALIAGNIAEVYQSEQFQELYSVDSQGYLYFDENSLIASQDQCTYKVMLKETDDILSISVFFKEQQIYSLDCMHYHQKTFGEDDDL